MVHLEPIVLVARFYPKDKSYEAKDDYDGVAIVQIQNDVAYIAGALGSTPKHSKGLFKQLKEDYNVTEVTWIRGSGKEVRKKLC
jgi:hypothetical protein